MKRDLGNRQLYRHRNLVMIGASDEEKAMQNFSNCQVVNKFYGGSEGLKRAVRFD